VRDFLLDTQMIRYWYDTKCSQHEAVAANVDFLRKQTESLEHKPRLLISVITLGEIEFGHRVNSSPNPSVQAEYLRFVNEQLPARLEVIEETAASFGELRRRLFDKYAPGEKRKRKMRPEQLTDPITSKELGIQENDLWLCAQAIAHDMVLVTNDAMRPIRQVSQGMQPGLLIQNWAVANAARIDH
jgi:tRNA(fMet)-specific endonuclease VapC